MALGNNAPPQIHVVFQIHSREIEGGLNMFSGEQIEYLWRPGGIGAIVKREGNYFLVGITGKVNIDTVRYDPEYGDEEQPPEKQQCYPKRTLLMIGALSLMLPSTPLSTLVSTLFYPLTTV